MRKFAIMLLAVMLITSLASLVSAGQAKHWICTNCGKKVSKEAMPSVSGCPRGGTHFWVINY